MSACLRRRDGTRLAGDAPHELGVAGADRGVVCQAIVEHSIHLSHAALFRQGRWFRNVRAGHLWIRDRHMTDLAKCSITKRIVPSG